MTTYIAFLRGINVGGHKKFLKSDQVEILNTLKFSSPTAYLHTGNWIFKSEENKGVLEHKISEAILKKQGWEVPILIKTTTEMASILKNCPFTEEKKGKSYFVLPFQEPPLEKVKELHKISTPNEEFVITPHCIYVYSSITQKDSKLSNNFFENKLKITATARNYNTMITMVNLSQQN